MYARLAPFFTRITCGDSCCMLRVSALTRHRTVGNDIDPYIVDPLVRLVLQVSLHRHHWASGTMFEQRRPCPKIQAQLFYSSHFRQRRHRIYIPFIVLKFLSLYPNKSEKSNNRENFLKIILHNFPNFQEREIVLNCSSRPSICLIQSPSPKLCITK